MWRDRAALANFARFDLDAVARLFGGMARSLTAVVLLGACLLFPWSSIHPGLPSILPPLVAILLAVALRAVLVALASGVWVGATFLAGNDPVRGLLASADQFTVGALAHRGNATVVLFILVLGGAVGVITQSGGGVGLARLVTRRVQATRGGLFGTWLMGLMIFFDDYTNALLVGSTMRPVTDRLRVSREKLAFVVDATSAPMASIAIIASWVGVEVGYIQAQYDALGLEGDGYFVFLQTLPYRFYPILMLVFVGLVIFLRRDFGPMLAAERRARTTGELLAPGASPASDFEGELVRRPSENDQAIQAWLPMLVVVAAAVIGLWSTGVEAVRAAGVPDAGLREIMGQADSPRALLWAAFAGSVAAIVVAVVLRSLSFAEAMSAWVAGARSVVLAVMVLVLAWALGDVCKELGTARFVIELVGPAVPVSLLPALVFVISAAVAFATGTSYGTMAVLFPLVVPLAHALAPGDSAVMLGSISSILAGSVWGDHCSPISDTTILSSMASSCDHVDHVRTQIPYALAVGLVALVLGDIATGVGLYPPWVGLLLGGAILFVVVRFCGKAVPDHTPAHGPTSSDK